jgi:hypothetical protein
MKNGFLLTGLRIRFSSPFQTFIQHMEIMKLSQNLRSLLDTARPDKCLRRNCLAVRSMAVPGVSSGTTSLATSIAPCKTYFLKELGPRAYIKFWIRPTTYVLGTLKGNCKVIFSNKNHPL